VPASLEGNSGATFLDAGAGEAQTPRAARKHVAGEGYFETAGIPILQGRSFRKGDEDVVIVSRTLANLSWGGEGAIGRRIAIAAAPARGGFGVIAGAFDFRQGALARASREFEVIGVAADVSEDLIASRKHPAIYLPLRAADYAQPSPNGVTLMLRSKPGVDAIAAAERELAAIDPSVTPFHARSMAEQIAEFMESLRSAAWTWNLLGAFGLILAASGLAGVTAYAVTRRGREIGIRVALGAQRRNVLSLVMREGIAVVAVGTLAGMMLTWVGIKAMSAFFFSVASVKSFEPAVLIGAPFLLAGLALTACYAAARKALAIDPAVALRRE
jgi:MacB-like periplasmic core domain/FtsX-like permease family